jgi:hypothetical protein
VRVGWTGRDPADRGLAEIGRAVVLQLRECGGGATSAPNEAGVWRTAFVLTCDSVVEAQRQALPVFHQAVTGAGLVDVEPVWLEVLGRDEVERRAAEPTIPALVSKVDIARRLGVSATRAGQLVTEYPDVFFEVVRTGAGPLYLASRLEAFAQLDRTPGRHRRARPGARGTAPAGTPRDGVARDGVPAHARPQPPPAS